MNLDKLTPDLIAMIVECLDEETVIEAITPYYENILRDQEQITASTPADEIERITSLKADYDAIIAVCLDLNDPSVVAANHLRAESLLEIDLEQKDE